MKGPLLGYLRELCRGSHAVWSIAKEALCLRFNPFHCTYTRRMPGFQWVVEQQLVRRQFQRWFIIPPKRFDNGYAEPVFRDNFGGRYYEIHRHRKRSIEYSSHMVCRWRQWWKFDGRHNKRYGTLHCSIGSGHSYRHGDECGRHLKEREGHGHRRRANLSVSNYGNGGRR